MMWPPNGPPPMGEGGFPIPPPGHPPLGLEKEGGDSSSMPPGMQQSTDGGFGKGNNHNYLVYPSVLLVAASKIF